MQYEPGTVVTPAPDLDAQIGRRVHGILWDLGLRQIDFATRVGMTQSAVAKRLRGELAWRSGHLVQAAAVLGTSVAYLIGETGDLSPVANAGAVVVEPLGPGGEDATA